MGRAGTVATALSFIWFHTLSDYQWPRNNDGDFDPHFYPEKTTKHSFFWKGRICAEEQLMSSPRCEGNVNLFVHCFEVQRVVFNRMKRQFLCNPFEFGSLLLFCTDCALYRGSIWNLVLPLWPQDASQKKRAGSHLWPSLLQKKGGFSGWKNHQICAVRSHVTDVMRHLDQRSGRVDPIPCSCKRNRVNALPLQLF